MTVNNGVNITENDLIDHLSFKDSDDFTMSIVKEGGALFLKAGTDTFNQLELNEGVITFGGAPGGPTLSSYSWV